MKILQINAVYGKGSTGVIVQDLHELSLRNGMQSYVAYSSLPKHYKTVENGYQIGKSFGKKLHALYYRIFGKQAYFSRHATKQLIKIIQQIQPDIIHLHNLHSNYIHLNKLLACLARENITTVVTLHDCWFYTGGCFHYTSTRCDHWLKDCKKCLCAQWRVRVSSAKVLQDRKKYFSLIPNLRVVGVSKWIAEEARRTFFETKNITTIYNGIDTNFFKPTSSNLRQKYDLKDKFVVLGTANKWLAPINRETLETVANGLDNESVLVVFGCDKENIKNLPKNVLLIDYIYDREILKAMYSMADVFANCTREESLSLVNVEAQACGTPVVTYCNTGAQETVDNVSGFSVETGNASAFLQKILLVKRNGKQVYTKQCRNFVINKFDRDVNYGKYIELYKILYKGKK